MAWYFLFRMSLKRYVWTYAASAAVLAAAGFAGAGAARASVTSRMGAVEGIREFADERFDAVVRGTVPAPPQRYGMKHGGTVLVFDFSVRSVPDEYGDAMVEPTYMKVRWYGPATMGSPAETFPTPRAGQGWQLHGRIKERDSLSGVPVLSLNVSGRDPLCRREEKFDMAVLPERLSRARDYASGVLSLGMEEHRESSDIVKAMVLGLNSGVSYNVRDFFVKSGTVHVFAISGLHVGIAATLIMGILSAAGVSLRIRTLVFSAAIIAYTMATGGRPSAVRACIMSLVFFCAPLFGRKPSLSSSICIALTLSLALFPRNITDVGFILSFACVIGIAVFTPPMSAIGTGVSAALSRRLDMRTLSLNSDNGVFGLRRRFAGLCYRILLIVPGMLAVSLAAFLASTPVTALIFGRVTPVSIVCNLAVIPLAFLVVFTSFLSITSGLFSSWMAETFNHANRAFTGAMSWVAEAGTRLPYACIDTKAWTAADTIFWLAGCCLFLFFLSVVLRRVQASSEICGNPEAAVRKR